ncbi:hypothetical protein MHO82_24680 [Vibrio sp. Of7-15]|uniref:hypothetical protein n=1 Tax=Vibrio sp. Of7-15 TaxID=2724879 RepID=UPI001EF1FEFA|nr:hypothetical protein [Vibrio sp. Of7-15]MCG7500064.1 hypothetical protein [Vibrio sp. Of7-15]
MVAENPLLSFSSSFDGRFFWFDGWPSQERGGGQIFLMAIEVCMIRWLWLVLLFAPLSSWAKLCPDGQFEVINTGLHECVDSCPVGYFELVSPTGTPTCRTACPAQQQRTMSWNPKIDGEDPKGYCHKPDNSTKPFEYGVYGCDMKVYQSILCFASGDSCQAKFRNTGELCTVAGPYGGTIPDPTPDPEPEPDPPNPDPPPSQTGGYGDSNTMPQFNAELDRYGCFSTTDGFVSSKCFGSLNSISLQNASVNYFNAGRLGAINDNITNTVGQLQALRQTVENLDLTLEPQDVDTTLDVERNRYLSELLKSVGTSGDSGSGSEVDLTTTEKLLGYTVDNLANIYRGTSGTHHFSAQIAEHVRQLELRSRDSGSGGGSGEASDLTPVVDSVDSLSNKVKNVKRELTRIKENNQAGFDSVVTAINGISVSGGTSTLPTGPDAHSPTSGINFDDNYLYSPDALTKLNNEIDDLKLEYKNIATEFKNNFSFASNLERGEYEERTLDLSINGNEVHYEVSTLKHLLDYKAIIYSVVVLGFGLMALYSALRI